eukprot:gnl/MRDRNA2_/MRDRNA2_87875_c0_seq1.p1 gnl/MRDRNA2_/MRDRNA2_87875_c0~~gnl/MRDRNA2_/MRDRNA2_87875_c0_seq1.p1  ORF type:complete len:1221 (+),score=194.90 gnl/MRDRNA2_/MRDRNA2_87875_c0_seq1:209-3871(+)
MMSPISPKSMGSMDSFSITNRLSSPKLSHAEAEEYRLSRLSVVNAQKISSLQYQSQKRDVAYESGHLHPVGGMMRLLAPTPADEAPEVSKKIKRRHVSLWIPDTIVWESEGKPTWYYTNSDGCVVKTTNFGQAHVFKRFQKKQSPEEPVAVLKMMNGPRNISRLVNTPKLKDTVASQGCPQWPVVLQRFIWPKGSHAAVYRCCWTARAPVCHINCIRSKHTIDDQDVAQEIRLLPSSMQPQSIDSYELKAGAIPGVSKAMQNLLKYLAEERHLLLEELVCDFLVDSCRQTWFLQVKAFTPREAIAEPKRPLSVLEVDDPGPGVRNFCGSCSCVFQKQDLTRLLTVHQVLEIHERLQGTGIELSWARSPQTMRLATRPTTVSGPMLRVCDACHGLHHALTELTAVSTAFHARLGVPSAVTSGSSKVDSIKKKMPWLPSNGAAFLSEPHGVDTMRRSPSAPAMTMAKGRSPMPQMPHSWQCQMSASDPVNVMRAHGPGVKRPKGVEENLDPPRRLMLRYRILLLIQELWLLTPDIVLDDSSLTVTFTLFGVKHRIPVRGGRHNGEKPSNPNDVVCRVDSLRVMHVFVSRADSLAKWVRKSSPVEFKIMSGREVLLETSMPMRRLVTVAEAGSKDCQVEGAVAEDAEMQFLDLPLRRLGLRVEEGRLRAVLGMSSGTVADTESINLRLESGLVYVPPQSFTVPEALPPPWLDILAFRSGQRQLSLKETPGDALRSESKECIIQKSAKSRLFLHFRLRGLHGLPGAQPGDPYMVELVIFQLVKVRQQTYCIERNRPHRGDTEVLAPVQLDACVALDELSSDSLRATLNRPDAAYVKCVRRGGRSALCPALQCALPLDRLEHSGTKRITGAFELNPPPDAPSNGGASRNGELAHLFANFSLDVSKGKGELDVPVLGPTNQREERLAGVGSDLAPTLTLWEGENVDQELPAVGGRSVERVKKPIIWRASTNVGLRESSRHRSKRSICRSEKRSRGSGRQRLTFEIDEQEEIEDDDDEYTYEDDDEEEEEENEDYEDGEDGAENEENDIVDADGSVKFGKRISFPVDDVTSGQDEQGKDEQQTPNKDADVGTHRWDDDTFDAFIEEYSQEDAQAAEFWSAMPISQFDNLRNAFASHSSTGDYSTGQLLPENLDKVFLELGYNIVTGHLETACMELGLVDKETKEIGFKGFLALMEAYFREVLEGDPSESDASDYSDKDQENALTIIL